MRYFLFVCLFCCFTSQVNILGHGGTVSLSTIILGLLAQSGICLTEDMRLTADPGVASSISTWSSTFARIDHEIISTAILPSYADSKRVVISYKGMYVHEVLVNHLVKLAQGKWCYVN